MKKDQQEKKSDYSIDDNEIKINIEWVFTAQPVKHLEGSEFLKSDIDLITQVDNYFKSFDRKVERKDLGIVNLTKQGIRSSIAHGIGRKKAAAFAAVPDVIIHGKIIDHQINWKKRCYDTFVIDAPIMISDIEHIVEIIVNQDKDGQRFYLHEVEVKEKAQSALKTGMDTSAPQAIEEDQSAFKTGMDTSAPQTSNLIITRKWKEIKEKTITK